MHLIPSLITKMLKTYLRNFSNPTTMSPVCKKINYRKSNQQIVKVRALVLQAI